MKLYMVMMGMKLPSFPTKGQLVIYQYLHVVFFTSKRWLFGILAINRHPKVFLKADVLEPNQEKDTVDDIYIYIYFFFFF